jgi:hypothetical protein
MSMRVVDIRQERAKRDLRLQIAWLRHRTAARVVAIKEESGRLWSWRSYLGQRPAAMLLGAASVGLALTGGMRGALLARGWQLARRTAGYALRTFVKQVRRRWLHASGRPGPMPNAGGDDVAS